MAPDRDTPTAALLPAPLPFSVGGSPGGAAAGVPGLTLTAAGAARWPGLVRGGDDDVSWRGSGGVAGGSTFGVFHGVPFLPSLEPAGGLIGD